MKKVELIIFDLDGTLVNSKESIARGINFALKEAGAQERDGSQIISYIGTGVDDLVKKSLGAAYQGLFEKTKRIFENYRMDYPDGSFLYPGVREILEYFKDKKKAIVSNRKYEFALPTLKDLGIYGYFNEVAGGDDLDCLKPSPCSLDKIITKFKTDKLKVIMVGDMDVDILAGKQAGVATCAVTYGIGKKEDILKARPDFVIDDILQLKKIIN